MEICVQPFTIDRIEDVIAFERELRQEEDCWGWEIDEEYILKVKGSFNDTSFNDCISLLAYDKSKVVGRIDCSMIKTRFDGETRAYLDWICVLKSYRHRGVAQRLFGELKSILKARGIKSLIAITASNEEAQRFYKSIPDSVMSDTGIWVDIK